MRLHEYRSKRIFAEYGVPIPQGDVARSPEEARQIATRLGTPVVIKAQVLVGGRGKAGGILLARDPAEAEVMAGRVLGMDIKSLTVGKVLVDEAADIAQEIYLGVVIDRAACRPVMMASSEGGVDIEEVARVSPERIVRVTVDPFLGLRQYQARELAFGIGLDRTYLRDFVRIAQSLYAAFIGSDASLAEINPLVITADGELLAVDGKMLIDDNALFRHPDLAELRDLAEEDPYEQEARRFGLSYVRLDGEIGCMVNGAGLAMATMDLTKLYGGEPANFLDIGGGARAEKVAAALRIIISDPNVKSILINIFGGILRCDVLAEGVVKAAEKTGITVPVVIRMEGTNVEQGRKILAESGLNLTTAADMKDAAQKVARMVAG